ncbi:MAG: hypothetical protein DCC49_05645 [Acidobacteria bacterium]|nr:MAG: hypothetical protein DCC49_05645 [Acidobacteriota bacterium]
MRLPCPRAAEAPRAKIAYGIPPTRIVQAATITIPAPADAGRRTIRRVISPADTTPSATEMEISPASWLGVTRKSI